MKIFNVIYNIVAIIVVLVFLFTAAVAVSGVQVFAVATGSMEPEIHEGSAVFVRKAETYEQGDVITAKFSNGNSFTHRVFRVDSDNGVIYTKGDANEKPDPLPTDMKMIVGKVMFSVPYIGMISLNYDRTTVVLVLGGVLIALGAVRFVVTVIKKPKGEKTDEKD